MTRQPKVNDERRIEAQAEEEATDPRLLLDSRGDAALGRDERAIRKDRSTHQGASRGDAPRSARDRITPGRDEALPPADAVADYGDDGGYGFNRDHQRAMNEPNGRAFDAPTPRSQPLADGGLLEEPSPGPGQPTGRRQPLRRSQQRPAAPSKRRRG